MELELEPIRLEGVPEERPLVISGPCSAETEEQVMCTAKSLAEKGLKIFRAGIWKPRTKPGGFEGIGVEGLAWLKQVKKETGITIEIISGQEEARMIYENHVECMQDRKGNYMYVDVGGGSTEINLLSDGMLCASAYYNLGTVRLLNDAVKPEVWERLATELALLTQGMTDISIIGSGGNINKLYRLAEKKDRKRQCFTVAALRELYEELLPLTPE